MSRIQRWGLGMVLINAPLFAQHPNIFFLIAVAGGLIAFVCADNPARHD